MSDPQTPLSGPQHLADILVVDDSQIDLQLLENILARQGYKVRPVASGRIALAAAQVDPA